MSKVVNVYDKAAGAIIPNKHLKVPSGSTGTVLTTTDTQTLTNKTLTSPTITGGSATNTSVATPTLTLTVQAVAAAGSGQGDAGAVTAASGAIIHGTGADGNKGIVLPTAAAGVFYIVKNADAANAILKVYPAASDDINALGANTAISMAANTAATFVAIDATNWVTVPLLPS